MSGKYKRSLFLNANRYQRRTILPLLILLTFLLVVSGLSYYWNIYLAQPVQEAFQLAFVKKLFPMVLILFFLLIFLYVYWVFFITNRILGPFERIVRELDEMIENKREWHRLKTRDGDEMFNQLIRRINVLIDQV